MANPLTRQYSLSLSFACNKHKKPPSGGFIAEGQILLSHTFLLKRDADLKQSSFDNQSLIKYPKNNHLI
jgi:hypothetical protein